ncbi:MAG: 5-carboxymethyl-2-hydroxymuconate Delta-isomerase [Chloroflexota bacterium]
MPHIILEYSANIEQHVDFPTLFSTIHKSVSDIGNVKIGNLKSRARKVEDFCVSDGEADQAFVHLEFRLLAGRTKVIKQQLGHQLLTLLEAAYASSLDSLRLQITVEIIDIDPNYYFKIPKGTLSVPDNIV